MKKIVLASNSPRRKNILKTFTNDFIQVSPEVDETFDPNFDIETNIMSLARKKSKSVSHDYPDSIVIAADTIVVKNDKILTKAEDEDQARKFLKDLSNSSHYVYTGFCIDLYNENISVVDYQVTEVKFKKLSDSMIEAYLKTDDWNNKAGAYAIQSRASIFVDYIKGDYLNVVGLPISLISDYLLEYFSYDLMEVASELQEG